MQQPLAPNLAGFREAQQRLREAFGRDVTFFTPIAPTYSGSVPSGAFDPETHRPYDPLVKPTSSGYASASVRCSVVYQPLQRIMRSDVSADALGERDRSNLDLIVDPSDHDTVKNAKWFTVDGSDYEIVLIKPDPGFGGDLQKPNRYVVYGQDKR